MRIRTPFAAGFVVFCLGAAYLGLSKKVLALPGHSDKGLHFVSFFILTTIFYWILETSRRRVIHLTLVVCTGVLSIGSEFLQGAIPNGREFDPYDIVANVLGSVSALLLSSVYHKRMLERKRANKHYDIVPGEELGDEDLELGERLENQTTGVVAAQGQQKKTVTEELDNWDENAEDWEEETEPTADKKRGSN